MNLYTKLGENFKITVHNKNYISIGVSVQATKFAGRNPECLGNIGTIPSE